MESTYLLALVATTIEMTVCLVNARQLWRLRKFSYDRSRRMLILGNALCGMLALWVLVLNIVTVNHHLVTPVLNPWIAWSYMVMNIVMTLYPISVIQPEWLSLRRSFFLFLPTLILGLGCLVFTGRWTPLATPADIWHHVWAPDVLLRLITLFIMLPYCFILLRLPHSYKSSSASFWWILNYSGGLLILCIVHVVLMLTNIIWLIIVLPLLVASFFLFSTEYELEERMLPSPEPEEKPSEETDPTPLPEAEAPTPQPEPEVVETDIWERVCYYMDREKVWKDPDLTLVSLSRLCATNITYLNRVIKKETGSGFKDMVNKKRVAEVATQLEQNADMDLLAAFFNAGYRSRTTAWRNFKEITGESPAEYKQRLKNN
jgi:AraC-like DNA-binding protein